MKTVQADDLPKCLNIRTLSRAPLLEHVKIHRSATTKFTAAIVATARPLAAITGTRNRSA